MPGQPSVHATRAAVDGISRIDNQALSKPGIGSLGLTKKPVHSKDLLQDGIGAVRCLVMQLDLDYIETRALNLLVETIEADRYPYSPRISAWIVRNSVAAMGKPRVYGITPIRSIAL